MLPDALNIETTPSLMELMVRLKHCCQTQEAEMVQRASLSPAEYACLRGVPASEPIGAGALSSRMGLSASRGGRVIERLVRRGLLERHELERDRRVSMIVLSRRGRSLKRRIETCLAECDQKLAARLSADEHAAAAQALATLLSAMERR